MNRTSQIAHFQSSRGAILAMGFPIAILLSLAHSALADDPPSQISIGTKFKIISVHPNVSASRNMAAAQVLAAPFPEPPLQGFLPLVALTTSDKHKTGDLVWERDLHSSFIGNSMNPPATENFVIGVADAGSTGDIISYCDSFVLGLTGSRLTDNSITLTGAGGDVDAPITYPWAMFVAPLSAVSGGLLDTNQLVGHSHDAMVILPEEDCESDEPRIPSLVGNELLAFYKTFIRTDQPQRVTVAGQTYVSPNVRLMPYNTAVSSTDFPRRVSMNIGPSGTASASYLGDIFISQDFRTPITPTVLSPGEATIPTGGGFFTNSTGTVGLREGPSSPDNPVHFARFLVDTGAQASVITPGMAATLSLPIEPDFTIEVLGVGGITIVPGYYVDYVRINALGGPLEFSNAPIVVIDFPSPDGQQTDGILGMNFFWNRNLVFDTGYFEQGAVKGFNSGFLHISNPIPFAYGDFDHDFDVDKDDLSFFSTCASGPSVPQTLPECRHVDWDMDLDIDMNDFGAFQRCVSGTDIDADPDCGL